MTTLQLDLDLGEGLVDPESAQPTRVGYRLLNDGSKTRISRKSGAVVDK